MEATLTTSDIQALNDRIHERSAFVDLMALETGKQIVGQKYMMERLLLGLLAGGHILLEGVPGLAKTLRSSPSLRPLMRGSAESSLPRTCCQQTWWER